VATLSAIRAGLRGLGDPASWGTGLSAQGARVALTEEVDRICQGLRAGPQSDRRVLIWCANNVFTAPMRWAAQLQAAGCAVELKASQRNPAPVRALGQALGIPVHVLDHAHALALLGRFDAVLAFGSETALSALPPHAPARRSLHGHRVSFAVVQGDDATTAHALAWDACLYDGAGCMSPAAVFCLGDAQRLAANLADAMAHMAERMPRGRVSPDIGPSWRQRTGLARILGSSWEGADWAVPLLPLERSQAVVLPRMVPVHAVRNVDALAGLEDLPLSTCATDLDPWALPFTRWCAPGDMQRPPMGPVHEGVDVIQRLLS
jgi:hypothetical protein